MAKTNWEMIKVSDFAEVSTGGTPSTSKEEYWEGGKIPWLNSGELNQDVITTCDNYITEAGLKSSAARMMPPDTVLIALTGTTTGKTAYLTFDACANQSVTGILPSAKHFPKYLYYYLSSIRKEILNDSYGGAQKHISQAYVKNLEIPLPSLATQQKIAAILDRADGLRQKDKQLLAKYDALAQSVFYTLFGDPVKNEKGWEVKKLESIAKIERDSIDPSLAESEFDFYVGLEDIEKETGNILNKRTTDEVELKSSKFIFTREHILYGKLRPYLNKVAIPDFNGICSTDIIPILPTVNKISKYFLLLIMRSEHFANYAHERSVGANLPRVNPKAINEYSLIVPPLKLQTQFATIISKIEQQKQQATQQLQKSEELFQSLLQRAFKGELVE